jgi:hypothetical protein
VPIALPTSLDGVAYVEILRGAEASADSPPEFLVEVPHGADQRRHYDALRERLVGELPADLHAFFHVNTDEGAWAYGRATAEAIVAAAPQRSALLVRCLIPRTFVDCNRPADYDGGNLSSGGLTAGIPVYVTDDRDRALLLELHTAYVGLAEAAFAAVCGQGGQALVPHTYGPRSLDIAGVDATIVDQLRVAYAPERVESWPIRAEVDLLTRDGEGTELAPAGVEAALLEAFTEAGFEPRANDTYYLHSAALGHRWSVTYPGQVTCLEVRRDLVVESWEPFEEGRPSAERVERIARVLGPTLERLTLSRASDPPAA